MLRLSALGLTVILAIFTASCDNGDGEEGRNSLSGRGDAIAECVNLCELANADEVDLSEGPCLSETVVEDWVCDVAHSPRTDEDNLSTNQCDNYPDTNSHFVEIDPDCTLIRAE